MTDYAEQRTNMVESQLRPSDITDRRILRAMGEVRREAFVPAGLRSTAYMDEDVRIAGAGRSARVMIAPRTLAMLILQARIEPGHRVLEVGAGSGYTAAVLARLAGEVIGVEADPALAGTAAATLKAEGVSNARIVTGDMLAGHPEAAPYDAIILAGGVEVVPAPLLDQLKDGGRLVAIEVIGGVGRAVVWNRNGMHFDRRAAFDAAAPVLPGFARPFAFSL